VAAAGFAFWVFNDSVAHLTANWTVKGVAIASGVLVVFSILGCRAAMSPPQKKCSRCLYLSTLLILFVALFAAAALSAPLPSCSDDEGACVGEDMDLSPEGIMTCLKGLTDRSAGCSAYLELLEGCAAELEFPGGVCGQANADGETAACLMQRVQPADLSEACRAALPKVEEATGLAKHWADGKRELDDAELGELGEDDADTYKRWIKKKKGPKSGKMKERDFAVKVQKKEKAQKAMDEAALAAAAAGKGAEGAADAAKAAFAQSVEEDKTGALKAGMYGKAHFAAVAKKALKAAKGKGKQEL
jgi:hypothetical protein